MALLDTLPAVQYFTENSTYHYTEENAPLEDLNNRDIALANAIDQRSFTYLYQVPGNGFNLTIAPASLNFLLLLDPSGTLATGTLVMPLNVLDGQIIKVSSSANITSLTLSPNTGQTIKNAPTSITAGNGFEYVYKESTLTWFRIR